ncbi:unnamed protein product [Periconia digitata]|uniref:Uncharacterized protein n=1 Tax=Periconia digitata TaxID=1303443 RepID=A0A9W4XDS3_9PLEO|nr:unnamed protein product [Periconia digitata]
MLRADDAQYHHLRIRVVDDIMANHSSDREFKVMESAELKQMNYRSQVAYNLQHTHDSICKGGLFAHGNTPMQKQLQVASIALGYVMEMIVEEEDSKSSNSWIQVPASELEGFIKTMLSTQHQQPEAKVRI